MKEELLRRIQLVDLSLLYECSPDIEPGDAVYVLDNQVFRAHVGTGASRDYLAAGFVQTKIGIDRCTVQRSGVLVSIDGFESGKDYYLSPTVPGKIVTISTFDKTRDTSKDALLQYVGRAESATHLAIGGLGSDFTV